MLWLTKYLNLRRLLAKLWSIDQRGVVWPATALALGLILVGAAMFRTAPGRHTSVPPGYVALVNGQGILMNDFISRVATETEVPFPQATPAQRAHVLREMIDEELQVQRALVLDLPETTDEVRSAMEDAVTAAASAQALAEKPTDAQLHAYYEAHISRYESLGQMKMRDLVLRVGGYPNVEQTFPQAENDATAAVYQLRSGTSLNYVMEHFGFVDALAEQPKEAPIPAIAGQLLPGAMFDYMAKTRLGTKLYEVAATLSTGQVSDPIVEPDGVHVLVMLRRIPPEPESFEAARFAVYSDYRIAQKDKAAQQNLRFLRKQAHILLAPGQSE